MPAALPPESPPPPVPRNRPFQFDVGMPIQILTLSPAGGCVVTAVMRHMPGLAGSTAADSMVVLGRATVAKLSQERTGCALATAGLGRAPNGGPGGAPRPATCPCPTAQTAEMIAAVQNV